MARSLLLLCVFFLIPCFATLSRFERMQLQSQQSTIGVVDVDAEGFSLHALGKHNYSIIALFSTTEKGIQCPLCGPVNEQFAITAAHFRNYVGGGSRHPGTGYESPEFLGNPTFLLNCDLVKCKDIAMKLQWREIPKIVFIPARDIKKNEYELEEFQGIDDASPDRIASWISEKTHTPNFKVSAPITNQILMYVAGILGVYFLVTRVLPILKEQYKQPMFWFLMSLAAYAFAMAGTVFNSINKPPWSYKHPQNGQLFLIYPQARQQFVVEGLIMAGLLSLGAILFTTLGAYVPTFKGAWPKRGIFLVLLISFYMTYNGIFAIFKMKYSYYPFA